MMRMLPLHAACLVGGLLLAGPGLAADPPKKEGSFGAGKTSGPVLTREQLRACLTQKTKVAQQDEQLPKGKAALASAQDELVRRGETLKASLEALDRTNAEAVSAYNGHVEARDRQIDEHQARVAAFNTRVEAAQVEREAFTKSCGNRSYFEEDAAAIQRGK